MNSDTTIKFISYIIAAILISFLFSYPSMLLWNSCLVPAISAIQPVTWLQMWGITILFSIMFTRVSHNNNKG